MKFGFITFLILGFLGSAVFSFFMMSGDLPHNVCLFSSGAGKPPCPAEDPLGFANFHINILKGFSTAAFNSILLSGTLAFLGLFIFAVFAENAGSGFSKTATSGFIGNFSRSTASQKQFKILRWLSLHENSPAFL